MSRRRLILLGIILGFLAAVGISFYIYYRFISEVKTPGEERPAFSLRDLFFPEEGAPPTAPTQTGSEAEGLLTEGEVQPLRQISAGPVAASVLFTKGSTTVIRFIEKGTGHIYETSADSLATVRISNKTIPRIQESFFVQSGNGLIIRYLSEETVKTAHLELLGGGESVLLTATILPDNIQSIAPSYDGAKIAYVLSGAAGSSVLVSGPNGAKPVQVFSSPLRGLLLRGFAGNFLLLTSRPSADAAAVAFLVDVRTGVARQTLRQNGLTALLSGNGRTVFYSFSSSLSFGATAAALYDRVSGGSVTIAASTLSDKCAWAGKDGGSLYCGVPFFISAEGFLPDRWYQGALSFNDSLWKIDAGAGETFLAAAAAGLENRQFDIIDLHVDAGEDYAIFTDKSDEVLWGVQL